MSTTIALNLHQCQCPLCQQGEPHPKQAWHQQINLLMSRLDEQQRRWYAGLEANRLLSGTIVSNRDQLLSPQKYEVISKRPLSITNGYVTHAFWSQRAIGNQVISSCNPQTSFTRSLRSVDFAVL